MNVFLAFGLIRRRTDGAEAILTRPDYFCQLRPYVGFQFFSFGDIGPSRFLWYNLKLRQLMRRRRAGGAAIGKQRE
jgi:hypothetical protein